MKKSGVLNSQLAGIIASMGHTDMLVIGDSGLPVPKNAELVDLALTTNIPRFTDVLKVVLKELEVEKAIIAEEMLTINHVVYEAVIKELSTTKIEEVTHEEFKAITRDNKNIAFIRTGEATPYANIILISGVTFD